MYTVSKETPIDNYSIIKPSDNQTDFIGGQTARITIPRSTGYFDSYLSRINFSVSVQNSNYKMCFADPVAGVSSMIDMIRLSQNGTIITEILEYDQLQHLFKTYSSGLSSLQESAHQKVLLIIH